jgi:hypothetical protein
MEDEQPIGVAVGIGEVLETNLDVARTRCDVDRVGDAFAALCWALRRCDPGVARR